MELPNLRLPMRRGRHKNGERPIGTERSGLNRGLIAAGTTGGGRLRITQKPMRVSGNLIQEVRALRLPRSKTKTRRHGTVLVARTPGHGVTWTVGGAHHDMTQEEVETDEGNLIGMRFLEPDSNLVSSGNQILPLQHPRLHLSVQLPRRTRCCETCERG